MCVLTYYKFKSNLTHVITIIDILAGDVIYFAGQIGGYQAGVHTMSRIQAEEQTLLLIDASNA